MKEKFYQYIQQLQDKICFALEQTDQEACFTEDIWQRPEGGGGRTRAMENGSVFEKAGVLISSVHGALPKSMQQKFKVDSGDFFACGLSMVLHPTNPWIPTTHANWRYFELYDKQGNLTDQWFGGGQDLTPYYLVKEDAVHWHKVCQGVCNQHHPDFYPKFKQECDAYFWNHHRDEARGIGGLFYDYLRPTQAMSLEQWYDFTTDVGDSFLEAYLPIVNRNKNKEYSAQQKEWQEIRRGRYVEFNLVHDRGTLFGLKTNGRTESILMSLPPRVQWRYNHYPTKNSPEADLLEVLKNPTDWV